MNKHNKKFLTQLRAFYALWTLSGFAIVVLVLLNAFQQYTLHSANSGLDKTFFMFLLAEAIWGLTGFLGQQYFASRR